MLADREYIFSYREGGALIRWPNLQALIDCDGEITIGRIAGSIDAATACDEDTTYAMLQRNDGESLVDVLTRLDQAVKQAIDEETTIDEINPP